MPTLLLPGQRKKQIRPYQQSDYVIAAIDRQIAQTYVIRSIALEADYAGEVRATLLRHDAPATTDRAVLYIHGYGDYFFHDHVRRWYNEQGYNFYALDLRKHGRSLLPHQRACYARDLGEYFPEITAAIRLIRSEDGNRQLLLQGHSTGGLTTVLYADRGAEKAQIDALVLNSPFFAFKASTIEKRLMNWYAGWSSWRPGLVLPVEFEGFYGRSLHRAHQGEWDYTQAWKPIEGHPLHAAWIRAINRAHRALYRGLSVSIPTLVMRSDKSATVRSMSELVFESDIVLEVRDMEAYSRRIGKQVEVLTVNNAIHDIFLSKAAVREQAFAALGDWLAVTNHRL